MPTTPVREALTWLESDGLVVQRSPSVCRATELLTRQGVEELFEMRLLLESAAEHPHARLHHFRPNAAIDGSVTSSASNWAAYPRAGVRPGRKPQLASLTAYFTS
ncbi:hypothetical protein [Streptomyces sp. NPDC097610]|uniref:hypothetical protein n=1 Tax=Streptomyces sp. NPDC097610 TaxID=3157227 RepID=UPI00331B8BAF